MRAMQNTHGETEENLTTGQSAEDPRRIIKEARRLRKLRRAFSRSRGLSHLRGKARHGKQHNCSRNGMERSLLFRFSLFIVVAFLMMSSFFSNDTLVRVYNGRTEGTAENHVEVIFSEETAFPGTRSRENDLRNWCNDVRITYNISSSTNPDLAIDANNDIHVVWQDNREGNWEIFYLKLSERGAKLINDMRLTNDTASSVNPKILLGDSDKKFHVIWSDNSTGSWEIYHMSLIYNHTTIDVLTNKKQISDPDPSDSSFPDVVINGGGTIKVAWQDERNGNWEIYYCLLDDRGAVIVSDTRITMDAYESTRVSIDIDSDGNTHLVYHEYRNASGEIDTNYGIHYLKLNRTGMVIRGENRLSIASELSRPRLRVDSHDMVHVVFDDTRYNAAGFSDIIYTMLDKNGTTLIDDVTLTPTSDNEETAVDSREPDITIDVHNNLHVIWMDNRDGYYGIYYTMLDPGNHTLPNPFLMEEQITLIQDMKLTGSLSGSRSPCINIDSDSNLHLVWQDDRSDSWELFYTRTDKPDLVIDGDNLEITPDEPVSGDIVEVSSTLSSISGSGAITTQVHFFYLEENVLAGEGISNLTDLTLYEYQSLLEEKGTSFSVTEEQLVIGDKLIVSGELNTTGMQGNIYISVAVDFNRQVDETDDTNNIATDVILVSNYSLDMSLSAPSVVEVDVNATIDFEANITNTGNEVNEIHLTVEDGASGWVSVVPDILFLDVNGTVLVSIEGRVPKDTLAGNYNITLKARPVNQISMTRMQVVTFAVRQFADIHFDTPASPHDVLPGFSVMHLTVRNEGNWNDTITVEASSENDWKCVFANGKNRTDLQLGPRVALTVEINISVPNSSPDVRDRLYVTTTSLFDPTVRIEREIVLVIQAKRMVGILNHGKNVEKLVPGSSHSFYLAVQNLGNVIDWYDVNVMAPENWTVDTNLSFLNISVGSETNITVAITPSADAIGQMYDITVRVNSTKEEDVISTLYLQIYVDEEYNFTISPSTDQTKDSVQNASTEYIIQIDNTGNVYNEVYLEIDDNDLPFWWTITLDSVSDHSSIPVIYTKNDRKIIVRMNANAQFKAIIEIVPPAGVSEGEYSFTLTARQTIDSYSHSVNFTVVITNTTEEVSSKFFLTLTVAVTGGVALIIAVAVFVRWYRGRG